MEILIICNCSESLQTVAKHAQPNELTVKTIKQFFSLFFHARLTENFPMLQQRAWCRRVDSLRYVFQIFDLVLMDDDAGMNSNCLRAEDEKYARVISFHFSLTLSCFVLKHNNKNCCDVIICLNISLHQQTNEPHST